MSFLRSTAIFACDLALIWIGLNVVVLCIMLVLSSQTPERCRMAWNDISQYGVLADVCKDDTVRSALSLADVADKMARDREVSR
jgi:hypothetical protein